MGRESKSEGGSQKKGLKGSASGAVQRLLRRNPKREPTEQVTVRFCPFCGAVLPRPFREGSACPQCKEVLRTTRSSLPPEPDVARAQAFEDAILDYAQRGYYVVRQKSDFVEMRKPKKFSKKWAAAWFVAGLPLPGFAVVYPVGYAVWHAFKGEKGVQMFVGTDEKLRVEESKE